MTRIALMQLNSGDDPAANLAATLGFFNEAVAKGAEFILTPEMTNCIASDRAHQARILRHQAEDETLASLREAAAKAGIWLLIGSIALLTEDEGGRFANRSFLIGPDGAIVQHYDKVHLFDVTVSENETYHESETIRPGDRAALAETPFGMIGMTICYDLRFPYLYRRLAQSGAQILTVPAAFTRVTGAAHWEVLLRARAIENGAFVLAPAQTGFHPERHGRGRHTYGHSLAVSPWGEVLMDAGTNPGIVLFDMDLSEVERVRQRIPSLRHDRDIG